MIDWVEKSLGEIAEVTKLAGFEFTKYIEYTNDGEIIALRALNLRNGELDLADVKRISRDISEKLTRSKIYKDDILLTYTGNGYGDCAIIEENDKYHLAPNICKIVPNNDVIFPYYLYCYIRSKAFYNQMTNNMTGSGQPTIPMKTIRLLKVPVPDMSVQVKIAKMIYTLNQKIRNNKGINNNLQSQCSLLYNKICLNSQKGRLGDLISVIETGSRPKGGAQTSGIPSIGAEKIESFGVYDFSEEKYISEEYFNKLKRGKVLSGDVLLYKDGAYTGKSSMALDGFPHPICAVNEHVFILRTKDLYAQSFLYFTLQNDAIHQSIYSLACGKAAQPGLNQKELCSIEIPIPSKKEIVNFEETVNPLMHQIALLALESRKLSALRDSLLPKLMSGEINVSDIEF